MNLMDIIEKEIFENDEFNIIKESFNKINSLEDFVSYDFEKLFILSKKYISDIGKSEEIKTKIEQRQNSLKVMLSLNCAENLLMMTFELEKNLFLEYLRYLEELMQNEKELDKNNNENIIELLKDFLDILKGISDDKISYEMLKEVYRIVNFKSKTPAENLLLVQDLYTIVNKQKKKSKVKSKDILELYKKYEACNDDIFIKMLNSHSNEISEKINLVNSEKILEFFKNQGIIKKFDRTALLKISVFADYSIVKDVYIRVMQSDNNEFMNIDKSIFYKDQMASVWITKENVRRKKHNKNDNPKVPNEPTLARECYGISLDGFIANLRFLIQNKELFSEDIQQSLEKGVCLKSYSNHCDLGDIVKVLSVPPWCNQKNIKLYKLFSFNDFCKLSVSSLEHGDVEKKIHYALELGLLNAPKNSFYNNLERKIPRVDNFEEKHPEESIRNYFLRHIPALGAKPTKFYEDLFYVQSHGLEEFYSKLFSTHRAGTLSGDFSPEDAYLENDDEFNRESILNETFITNRLNEFIEDYDSYNEILEDDGYQINDEYYDSDILNEPVIDYIEKNHLIIDEETGVANEFLYEFDKKLISRYKFLHFATILKKSYGYLVEDMVKACLAKNSYMTEEEFKCITKVFEKRNEVVK